MAHATLSLHTGFALPAPHPPPPGSGHDGGGRGRPHRREPGRGLHGVRLGDGDGGNPHLWPGGELELEEKAGGQVEQVALGTREVGYMGLEKSAAARLFVKSFTSTQSAQ